MTATERRMTMILNKWNFKTRKYEPYEVPDNYNVKTFSMDMEEIVNCPHCGREIKFGDGYTSRQIHTKHGMGFAVCADCYEKEFRAEQAASKEAK